MNEEIILGMVQPYVNDGTLTYREFDKLFDMLSLREQYTVTDVLYNNGILLIDDTATDNEEITDIDYDEDIENTQLFILDEVEDIDADIGEEDEGEFSLLYDEALFQDSEGYEEHEVTLNKNIRQRNETLCALIQQGNQQAKQDLCEKNRKLVDKYVVPYQKFFNHKLSFDDLEQAGLLGLLKAANRYDSSKGTAFSTYAVFWIKQSIRREICDHGYTIRIPVHMMDKITKVNRLMGVYAHMDTEERIDTVAAEMETSVEDIKRCIELSYAYISPASLNTYVGEDGETELIDLIPDEKNESIYDEIEQKELKILLKTLMDDVLREKERDILVQRFGIEDGRPKTLEEVGKMYGVTRERIRQIEAKAIKKLRNSRRSKPLTIYNK